MQEIVIHYTSCVIETIGQQGEASREPSKKLNLRGPYHHAAVQIKQDRSEERVLNTILVAQEFALQTDVTEHQYAEDEGQRLNR